MKSPGFFFTTMATFLVLGSVYLASFESALLQPISPINPLRDILVSKHFIAEQAPSPRMWIIGGSSAWFGFDGEVLSKGISTQVVNLGSHAEVPLEVMLWNAEKHARSGDTVLLAAELVHYLNPRRTTFGATVVSSSYPDYLREGSIQDYLHYVSKVPPLRVFAGMIASSLKSKFDPGHRLDPLSAQTLGSNLQARWAHQYREEVPGYYNYLESNRFGDFDRPRTPQPHHPEDYFAAGPSEERRVWTMLAEQAQRFRQKGIRCFFTWPPFESDQRSLLEAPTVHQACLAIAMKAQQAGWIVIGTPEDNLYPGDFFYDTGYHLTNEGARARSTRLVERFREVSISF